MATVRIAEQNERCAPPLSAHRFTVEQYDRMAELGFLTPGDRVELLEGWISDKMPQDPPHASATELTRDSLQAVLSASWRIRDQKPIAAPESRPEPDLAVVRGPLRRYDRMHPTVVDIALVIEVSDTTLDEDRGRKQRIYARARIPIYWIINLVDRQVEVYAQPRAGRSPLYREHKDYGVSDQVPLVIEGREIGHILVRDVLPR